jgi:hypothetical protein
MVSDLAYSASLKIFFSETSVDFQRTTERYIPEDMPFRIPYSFCRFTIHSQFTLETKNQSIKKYLILLSFLQGDPLKNAP